MDQIAWVLDDISIRWSSVVMVMAVLTGILFFLAAVVRGNRKVTSAALALPLAILLSLLFGKILHRYFLPDAQDGYVLMGAFAGCLCAAVILKGTRLEKNMARLLDVMSIGGCAAIALGRLACFFTADDRGRIIPGTPGLPLAWPVTNVTSGETEYRLAVFLFQSLAALLIFFVLLLKDRQNTKTGTHRDGDLTLLFLLLYAPSQIVLDSLRYDALHLRSNGFIGAVQLACAVSFCTVIGILLTRLVNRNGFRLRYGFAALFIAACIGTAAYMEYFVQRHGGQALFGYTVMTVAMMGAAVTGTVLWKKCGCNETTVPVEAKQACIFARCMRGVISAALISCFLLSLLLAEKKGTNQQMVSGERVMDQFFMNAANALPDATADIRSTEKRYWISADADRAPKPNKKNYGRTTDPEEISQVLEKAETLLDGQNMYFDPNVQTLPGTEIRYYRDDTILCVTWKQEINNSAYSFSEVKIADPSQFRRYFSGGEYGSGKLVYPTEMANSVNSVCAISGDYYMFRNAGVVVYKGKACRANTGADTCYVDEDGNLLFTAMSERFDMESAQRFVDDNHILFSVAFGPILVEDGQKHAFGGYGLGEVGENYARAAICQMDTLHYLLVNATGEAGCPVYPTMYAFQDVIASTGCQSAYALDGGQTAAMMINGELINSVFGGYQRKISDVIYFCTALPNS